MASKVDICNLALAKLGDTTIADITENTRMARLLNSVYDIILDEVLRAYEWNFATGRAQLARLEDDPIFEFTYQYSLPSDFIKFRKFFNQNSSTISIQYRIEGRKLLTNEEVVQIIYTKKVINTTEYDASFISAFAVRLAYEICEALTGKTTLKQTLASEYQFAISNASTLNGNENSQETSTSYVDARS